MENTGVSNVQINRGLGSHEAEDWQRVKASLDWLLGSATGGARLRIRYQGLRCRFTA